MTYRHLKSFILYFSYYYNSHQRYFFPIRENSMNVQLFFVFVLIDLSFEKMPRKFVELQIKMLHIYKWLVCFGLCCKVRMRTFPFSILFDWKKKDYFKNIKLWIFFFTTKMHWKSSKKKQKKKNDSGVGFCNREGQKEKKILSNWGIFLLFFYFTLIQ